MFGSQLSNLQRAQTIDRCAYLKTSWPGVVAPHNNCIRLANEFGPSLRRRLVIFVQIRLRSWRLPLRQKQRLHLERVPPSLTPRQIRSAGHLVGIMEKCLQKARNDRFQSMAEVLAALA